MFLLTIMSLTIVLISFIVMISSYVIEDSHWTATSTHVYYSFSMIMPLLAKLKML